MLVSEISFLYLLFSLFLRLSFKGAYLESFAMWTYFLFSMWVYFLETPLKKKIKKILPLLSVPVLYFALGPIMEILATPPQDLLLQKIDHWLVGGNLSLKIQPFVHPILTECMYVIYFLFFAYVIGSLIRSLRACESLQQAFYAGLFTVYWIGFLGYSLVPAVGPYVAMTDHLGPPLQEGILLAQPIYKLIVQSNNHVDVFPSLHCAVSAFCLFFDWRHRRRRFWLYLPFCILVWISTVYLSYHYFIDIVAGFALAFLALKVAHSKWIDINWQIPRRRVVRKKAGYFPAL